MTDLPGKKWFPYAALAAVSAALYFRTAAFGFTGLDDGALITGSLPFLSSLSHIPAAFSRDAFGGGGLGVYYRPLLTVSLMLDTFTGGGSPAVYHLGNAALHAAACMALFCFLRAWGHGARFSLAAALLFCAHPLLTPAVAWLPGRNDILLAFFTLLSAAFFLKALAGERKAFAAHLVFYVCALFTKESAVVLPPLLAACAVFIRSPSPGAPSRAKLAGWWAGLTAAWLLARALALGSFHGHGYAGPVSFFSNFPALVSYFGKAVFPYNLSPLPVLADLSPAAGLIALAAAAALAVRGGGSGRVKLFGLAWFFAWLLPALPRAADGIAPDFAEHRAYTALAGLLLFAGELRPPERFRRAAPYAAAAVFVLFAAVTEARLGCFRDGLNFWESAVKGSPSGVVSRTGLGAVYFSRGLYAGAEAQWRKGLELAPGNAALKLDLGSAAYAGGRPGEAAALWGAVLASDPANARALTNMAVMWYDRKDYRKAAPYVGKLLAQGRKVHPALAAAAAPYLR